MNVATARQNLQRALKDGLHLHFQDNRYWVVIIRGEQGNRRKCGTDSCVHKEWQREGATNNTREMP